EVRLRRHRSLSFSLQFKDVHPAISRAYVEEGFVVGVPLAGFVIVSIAFRYGCFEDFEMSTIECRPRRGVRTKTANKIHDVTALAVPVDGTRFFVNSRCNVQVGYHGLGLNRIVS